MAGRAAISFEEADTLGSTGHSDGSDGKTKTHEDSINITFETPTLEQGHTEGGDGGTRSTARLDATAMTPETAAATLDHPGTHSTTEEADANSELNNNGRTKRGQYDYKARVTLYAFNHMSSDFKGPEEIL